MSKNAFSQSPFTFRFYTTLNRRCSCCELSQIEVKTGFTYVSFLLKSITEKISTHTHTHQAAFIHSHCGNTYPMITLGFVISIRIILCTYATCISLQIALFFCCCDYFVVVARLFATFFAELFAFHVAITRIPWRGTHLFSSLCVYVAQKESI